MTNDYRAEKLNIYNVFIKCRQEQAKADTCQSRLKLDNIGTVGDSNPNASLRDALKKAAEVLGVEQNIIMLVVNEHSSTGTFSNKKIQLPEPTVFEKLDKFQRNAIREKVHEFFYRNERPTFNKVLSAVYQDPELPKFRKNDFKQILKDLNFKSEKGLKKKCLVDKTKISFWRSDYLRKITDFRKSGRKIYYVGEIILQNNYAASSSKTEKPLTVVCGIGSEDGFLKTGLGFFRCRNIGLQTYSYEKWFSKVLNLVEDNSVLVVTTEKHNARKCEDVPNSTWWMFDIEAWLTKRGLPSESYSHKSDQLRQINAGEEKFSEYDIDEVAKNLKRGLTVLRIPPNHLELNPIERVWAKVKAEVSIEVNEKKSTKDFKTIVHAAISHVTVEDWKTCIHDNLETEEKFDKLGQQMDDVTDALCFSENEKVEKQYSFYEEVVSSESESDINE